MKSQEAWMSRVERVLFLNSKQMRPSCHPGGHQGSGRLRGQDPSAFSRDSQPSYRTGLLKELPKLLISHFPQSCSARTLLILGVGTLMTVECQQITP